MQELIYLSVLSPITLPESLDSTLQKTNGSVFRNSLLQESLLDTISNTSKITVFVPGDTVLNGGILNSSVLQQHILPNALGYTPDMYDGKTYPTQNGTTVTISIKGTDYYVNNAKIVRADVITKNGVVHFIDALINPPPAPSSVTGSGATGSRVALSSTHSSVATGIRASLDPALLALGSAVMASLMLN